MNIVVPLAGPDFVSPDGRVKALTEFNGEPLLRAVLKSRLWAGSITDDKYTFVLQDTEATRHFWRECLLDWYPRSRAVFLSHPTRGAALSAIAGLSEIVDLSAPLAVDLGDIYYHLECEPEDFLHSAETSGAVVLAFESNNPSYSYFALDADGNVLRAAEKSVISNHASAGTYVFRSGGTYAAAVAHAVANEREQTYNGLFYVCPLINGVLAQGSQVKMLDVTNVIDVKNT
ncbi:hypothetical protein [Agrobacterium salinitolerans]|uniref:hypothetical protein n=1 Tax=Agrobacterium salinitolerans TaxID=1183413 RepID=UPI001747FE8F